jgi:hypothetical protein
MAIHLLGLLLPEMDNHRWNFRLRIDVWVLREVILLVERVMHIPGDDGIPSHVHSKHDECNTSDASSVERQCKCCSTNVSGVLTMVVMF